MNQETQNTAAVQGELRTAKKRLDSAFFKKGITLAILSGICYGLYSAFLTYAETRGVWGDWFGANKAGVAPFFTIFVLGAIGSAVNDSCSAIWAWIMAAAKGKLGDFFKVLKTKPGMMMVICALVGGPLASTCYVVALNMCGSVVIPITALCPAIGAILGRVIYKQELNLRMAIGVFVCVAATIMIGSTSLTGGTKLTPVGFIIAFLAALGWGIEGCVAGYGTTLIDYEIGIAIRQTTSGLSNMIILVPILSIIGGSAKEGFHLLGQAWTNGPAMIFFIVSGFFALFAYSLWYKGNSMCGAPLGMACNGAYSFWGPFFCMIIVGIIFKQPGWTIAPIAWVAAIVMFFGIVLIATNPLDLFKKKTLESGEVA